MTDQYAEKIAGIAPGKTFGVRGRENFYFVRREGPSYQVWCGWIVPEAYDDDADSFTSFLGKPERPAPWVGRSLTTDSAARAAEAYAEYKAAVLAGRMPTSGEIVGSVVRDSA